MQQKFIAKVARNFIINNIMPKQSVIILSGTTTVGTTVGDKYKADGYFGLTDGLHTVSYNTTAFDGTIKMQGTLAQTPSDNDFFDISGTTLGGDSTVRSTTVAFNFTGNFTFVRAKVILTSGTVDKILYNY